MASSSSRKFDSSGSNNPRKKRKSKKGAKTTRALGSARSRHHTPRIKASFWIRFQFKACITQARFAAYQPLDLTVDLALD